MPRRKNLYALRVLYVENAFSNYFEAVREVYYPFESGLLSGTAEVYAHEIPGGQYSNLRPQAASLGLADKWEDIKRKRQDEIDSKYETLFYSFTSKKCNNIYVR